MPTPGHTLDPNKPATRFKGPLLVGGPAIMGIGADNGSSTEPLISFWNAPEFGLYVGSSSKVALAAPGGDILVITSSDVQVNLGAGGSTAMVISSSYVQLGPSSGTNYDVRIGAGTVLGSSSAGDGVTGGAFLWVPVSTDLVTSSGAAVQRGGPEQVSNHAAVIWDATAQRLLVWSTADGSTGAWFGSNTKWTTSGV